MLYITGSGGWFVSSGTVCVNKWLYLDLNNTLTGLSLMTAESLSEAF